MGLRALLIEDSASWYGDFKMYLKKAGFDEVDLATNYRDAMKLSGGKYDLIVCDTMDNNYQPMFPEVIMDMRRRGIDTRVIANSNNEDSVRYWRDIKNVEFVEKGMITPWYFRDIVDTLNE